MVPNKMPPQQKQQNQDFSLRETSPDIGGRKSISTITNDNLTLVEQRLFLYVRILKAKLVPSCHRPFVELGIGSYKAATRVLQAPPTHNPEWNQAFAFAKDSRLQGNTLEIILKDVGPATTEEEESSEGKSQPKIMGRVYFEMGDIPTRFPPDSPLAPQWYRLEDGDRKRVPAAGELMAAVWIGSQADDAFTIAWHSDVANVGGESVIHTRSKVYHSPRLWYLRIQLIGAQDLVFPDKNHNRRPEVCVRAILGHMILKSRISPDRTEQNQELVFVAAEPFDDPLILIVEDGISGGSNNIGRSVIPLESLERRLLPVPATGEKWINLEKVEKDQEKGEVIKFGGRLHLKVFLDGVYHVFDEPTYYSSDLRATSPKLWPEKIGTLEVGILKAENLVPMKTKPGGTASTDAYCVAKYGQKWVRTSTVLNSFAPSWNEQYYWDVYDPYTVITIGVFDNSQFPGGNKISDPRIGKVRIRLSTLETGRIYTLSYPLIVLQPNGVKKTGELHLAVKLTTTSMVNFLHTYTQPLFPQMHYIDPMSVYNLDSLRAQATFIISARLQRADPPLRKEVVEYMLDAGASTWSLRKGKVNIHRLISSLRFLSTISKGFNWIREWNNVSATVTFYIIFLILVYFPQLILPCLFLTLFVAAIMGYPRRPRQPPHVDVKLSRAEDAAGDELDEELDTFPSSKQGEVLRNRYDRMRGIGGKVVVMIGDIATQIERVHCLFSWRDPRATMVFLVMCLVCCGLVYMCRVRYIVILGGSYVIRPPGMRNSVPCLTHNFLRRLPSKMDSLL
ncbi:FT-interacting protein 7 [Linum perenne]